MEWEILVLGGGTLFAFVTAIVRPLIKLTNTLTTLDLSIKNLCEGFKHTKQDLSESKCDIYMKLDDHEYRITKVECGLQEVTK